MEKGSSSKNNGLGASKGRRKIEMKKIRKPDDLLISFSKRKFGIHKKVSELAILCGAEVGFFIFSPAGKPYSYGHPSVHDVADRFMPNTLPGPPTFGPATDQILEARRRRHMAELSDRQERLLDDLEDQRVRAGLVHGDSVPVWWDPAIKRLPLSELKDRKSMLAEVHAAVAKQAEALETMTE